MDEQCKVAKLFLRTKGTNEKEEGDSSFLGSSKEEESALSFSGISKEEEGGQGSDLMDVTKDLDNYFLLKIVLKWKLCV